MQETAEGLLRIAAGQPGDGLVDQRVRVGGRVAEDAGQQREFCHPAEQREDHGLHRHDGAVGRPRVAPRLKVMGGGDVHAGQRGGLVNVVAVPDDLGHRFLQRRPVEIGRRVVDRDCRRE